MPANISLSQGRSHGVRTQAEHAREAIVLRLFHLSLPVWSWLGVGGLAGVLRLVFPGAGTAVAVSSAGLVLAALDLYLRAHRQSIPGRWIGAVTTVAVAGWLTAAVVAGWGKPLFFAYALGGLLFCLGWIYWMAHGDPHDLGRAFVPAAETAFGMPGSRLSRIRRHRSAGRNGGQAGTQHTTTTATLAYPRGQLVTKDAAARLEHLEASLGYEPGSISLTSSQGDAGTGNISITSPRLLTAAPLPWPGPSAPGTDMSVPFRLGVLQDGREFLYPRLPIGHRKVTGITDSGKTMSLAWNMLAEGITRIGYAAFAVDVVKGDQYLGALRPALHQAETSPAGALGMLAGLHRARLARCNYLAAIHATEWYPGCGLSFVDVWLEEAPGILRLLGKTAKDREQGRFMLEEWVEDVSSFRSAGMSVTASYQQPDKTQAFSTAARAQFGDVCFGVADSGAAEFGLSELQRERGCRPQLWGASYPGMAYWDTATIPEADKTLAMRHYFWGANSERIAAYASEWPASRRKLDDVTAEALAARPGRPASSGFPTRRPAAPSAADSAPADSPAADSPAAGSAAQPAGQPGPAARHMRIKPEEALKRVRAQLSVFRLEGTQFTVRQLVEAVGHDVVCPASTRNCGRRDCTARTRGWLYTQVDTFAKSGLLAVAYPGQQGGSPARYQVTGDPEGESV